MKEQGELPQNLAIVFEGGPVGGVGFKRQNDLNRLTAETGYWVGEAYWGRGLATEALRLATAYAFDRFDFERVQACVLEGNPASRRVVEKAGFALEGRLRRNAVKDGEVMDSWVYARLRVEPRSTRREASL